MASSPVLPPNRHVPFKKGGWGAALLTVVGAVATFLTAFYIHKQTYRHPTDLMMRTYPHADASHGAAPAAHGAAPAAHGATPAAPAPAGAPATTPAPAH